MKKPYRKPRYHIMPKDRNNKKLRRHGRILERMATAHINRPEVQKAIEQKIMSEAFGFGVCKNE